MDVVPFPSFVDSSHRGTVEQHVQCVQSPMHFSESAPPCSCSRLHSLMNFGSIN